MQTLKFRKMPGNWIRWRIILLLLITTTSKASMHCEQTWDDIKAPHIVADVYNVHLFKINSTDEYKTYMPNTQYQVTVRADDPDTKFIRFYLTVENENKTLPHGTLELYDAEITQFSQDCPNSVVQVSQVLKDEVSTYWTSPEEGSGCVIFRVSVMESPSRWFMDGTLEQKFCQDPKAAIDDPGPVLPECCACDEAKYELAFEGLWSRYTHPKNFPSKPWSARFSDVIGASHTSDYRFWEYNGYASEGLKQVAENGITPILESELKNQSEHIRTIIKARGINFPNITSKTFAVFRVDQQHHLVSLVSMIDPSPDWFVGVSGLELCLSNCSWAEHKELNLYPIDAGTDDGITYESIDAETQPHDIIRRITTLWPEDERSPFYDETAIDMNPMAKLYLKRQRVYEKNCNNITEETKEEACRLTSWGEWESCSVTCGRGVKLRQRKYKNEKAATKHNCEKELTDRVFCYAEDNIVCPPDQVDEKKCPMTQWSEWTPCTKTCGPESRTRDRNFRGKKRRKECKSLYPNIELQQTLDCENPSCGSNEGGTDGGDSEGDAESTSENSTADDETKCKSNRYTEWSFWTPCSVSCGTGTKSRSRQIKPEWNNSPDADKDLSLYDCQYETTTCEAETKSCEITKELMEVICSQLQQPGQCPDGYNDNSLRYYYDRIEGKCIVFHYAGCNGNMNNFRTLQECQATCGNFQDNWNYKNYKVKLSSIVTYNVPLTDEQRSYKSKREKCDDEKSQEQKKKKKKNNRGETKSNSLHDKVDCRVSEWSDWSPCYSCKGYRTMSRDITTHPRNGGKLCPSKLIRRQKCHKVLPECDLQNDREIDQRSLDDKDSEETLVSVDCRVSPWSPWSTCTASCGRSQRRRIRNIAIAPRGSGKQCPALAEIEDCQVPAC